MDSEFQSLISPYLSNCYYLKLLEYRHHNTTRLNHLYNVAVYSYWLGSKLEIFCRVDFEALLAGALLHDFYLVKQHDKTVKACFLHHPEFALINSEKHFELSEKEKNIILSHMFPIAKTLPTSKEAWIVSFSDKFSALMEACFHKNFAIPALVCKR